MSSNSVFWPNHRLSGHNRFPTESTSSSAAEFADRFSLPAYTIAVLNLTLFPSSGRKTYFERTIPTPYPQKNEPRLPPSTCNANRINTAINGACIHRSIRTFNLVLFKAGFQHVFGHKMGLGIRVRTLWKFGNAAQDAEDRGAACESYSISN